MRLLVSFLLLFCSAALAKEIEFPMDSRVWFNSRPVSLQKLTGKGVVLYFFEEG